VTVRYTTSLEGITADSLRGGFWVGWPDQPTAEVHLAMLRGSESVVLALAEDSGDVVGFVNAVGDGVLAAYVPCLEVLPGWHGQGIGTELVRRILAQLAPRYMVDLVCDDELEPFYQRLGFVPYRAMIRRDRSAILSAGVRFTPDTASNHEHGGRDDPR
jgi:GNAT superfamily N-acetyltransferase